jgi:hypothetical protein
MGLMMFWTVSLSIGWMTREKPGFTGHLLMDLPEPDTEERESKDFSFELKIPDALSGEQNEAD